MGLRKGKDGTAMNGPLISVIHATRGRPQKAVDTMLLWLCRAKNPGSIEYVFVVNADDPTADQLFNGVEAVKSTNPPAIIIKADVKYSAPAWNVGASSSTGMLLVQGQDDVEPPTNWDSELCWLIEARAHWNEPVFIAVGDGYRKGPAADLCCTAIMTRAYFHQKGHFLFPGYRSVFSDDDVTYNALRDARDGVCTFIDAREKLVFLHRHHYHDKTVPWDQTYAHENSAEAYAQGQRLFLERNPRSTTDGLKKW